MTRRATIALLAVLVLLLIAGFGCSADGPAVPLDGTHYKLIGWSETSINAAEFDITANFAGGKISGHSAVNTYGGTYTAGPGKAFSVSDLASTEMAGPAPAMRAESTYLRLLQGAKSYREARGQLTLFDASGKASLIFRMLK